MISLVLLIVTLGAGDSPLGTRVFMFALASSDHHTAPDEESGTLHLRADDDV